MERYDTFTVEDFVMDDYFRKWVKDPTKEGDEFWESWLKLNPNKRQELLQAKKIILLTDFKRTPVQDIDADRILSRIRGSITAHPLQRAQGYNSSMNFWWKVAAAVVGLLVTAISLYTFIMRPHPYHHVVHTDYGKKERVILPDQSVVVLNANSELRYANNWNEHLPREVWLEGEAYFEVRKSEGKGSAQFIVHTDHLEVEVLGTEFNVNSRQDKTQVTLNSGEVKLSSEKVEREVMMKPGEMAELKKGDKDFVKKQVNPDAYSSWVEEKLVFTKTPFIEIVHFIENNYGFEVTHELTEIDSITFTATIPSTNLDVLLRILSETYNVTIVKEEKTITITPK